jgi:hypothetical protein
MSEEVAERMKSLDEDRGTIPNLTSAEKRLGSWQAFELEWFQRAQKHFESIPSLAALAVGGMAAYARQDHVDFRLAMAIGDQTCDSESVSAAMSPASSSSSDIDNEWIDMLLGQDPVFGSGWDHD